MFDITVNEEDLSMVSFYKKETQCISNQDLKQMILDHLFQNYNIRMNCTNKYFRTFDPENDLATLKKYKHLAYINTNQNINLLLLVKFGNKPVCLFVDKVNCSIYFLKCQFSPSLYDGTIFEGELVESNCGPYFMISDFLVYMRKDLSTISLDHRLSLLKSIFSPTHYHPDPALEPFKIIIKDFVEYSQLESYINTYIPSTPYKEKVSGLIFRPITNSNKNLIYNFRDCGKNIRTQIPMKLPTSVSTISHIHNQRPISIRNQSQMGDSNLQGVNLIDIIHKKSPPKIAPNVDKSQQNNPIQTTIANFQINTEKHKEARFLLFETGNPDDYILKLISHNGQLFQYGYALINDMKTSQHFQKLLSELTTYEKKDGICVSCKYHPVFKKWKPIEAHIGQPPTNISDLQ